MADDWWKYLIPVAQGATAGLAANQANNQMQGAYDQMLANLQQRFGDYDAIPAAGYQNIQAQQVGPSALGQIAYDPQAKLAQQNAMAQLGQISDMGGLNLADRAALNTQEGTLNRNVMARRQGLSDQMAARGQLGSGAQMAMDLANQQNAAESANQRAEGIAAQAQQRAMEAIIRRGDMGRQMGNDDYARQADAARARDMIEARNAAARTDASKYNNTLRGQGFQDQLARAQGKTSLTNAMNRAVLGKGEANRNTTLGYGEAGTRMLGGLGSMGSNNNNSNSTTPSSNTGGDTSTDMGGSDASDVNTDFGGGAFDEENY